MPFGSSIETTKFSQHTVQPADFNLPSHLLTDTASLNWNNTCVAQSGSCTTDPQTSFADGSTLVQQLSSTTASQIHDPAHLVVTVAETGATVHDFVSVTGQSSRPTPTGNVTIEWFTNDTCADDPAQTSANVPLDAAGQVDATGFAQGPLAAGLYGFQAHYLGDATYSPSDGPCEQLRVVDPKPVVTVVKSCPNGKQSDGDRFGVVLNGTATGDVLDCGGQANVTLDAGTNSRIREQAASATTNLANYAVSYSGCDLNLPLGATATCTITNTRITSRSQPLTVGYWKNHRPQLATLLPVYEGSFLVSDAQTATAVFNAMNCGSSKDAGVIGCLAGQLLAGKLNVKNGANNCITPVIAQADALLVAIGYQGPAKPLGSPLTSAQRHTALQLQAALDKYNSGKGC